MGLVEKILFESRKKQKGEVEIEKIFPNKPELVYTDWGLSPFHNDAMDYLNNNFIQWEQMPIVEVPVLKLIPTQSYVFIDKVKRIQEEGVKSPKGIWITKVNGKYYLEDGHHRVAAQILSKHPTIKGYFFDYDKIKNKKVGNI